MDPVINTLVTDVDEFNELSLRLDNTDKMLCVLHLNVQRISNLNKFQNILTFVGSMVRKPDVIILTETWITKDTECLYNIRGYESFHSCRVTQSAGIAFYFKEDFECELIDQSNGDVSFLHLKMNRFGDPENNLLITAVYLPDVSNFPLLDDLFNQLLSSAEGKHLIMGDFNVNILNKNLTSRRYMNTIESYGYSIKNNLVTRPSSETCIDHIITNFDDTVCVTLANDLSDHNSTIAFFDDLSCVCSKNGYKVISRYKTDYNRISEDMKLVVLDNTSAAINFSHFHESLTDSVKKHTTVTYLKIKKNNPHATDWINETLIKLSKRKHRLLRKRASGVLSHSLESRIEEVSNRVSELKRELRESFANSKFGPNVNFKTKWRNLNNLLGRNKASNTISRVINSSGESINDLKQIAELLNENFVNVSSNVPSNSLTNFVTPSANCNNQNSFFLIPSSPVEVSSVIKDLNNKKGVGWDGISTAVLKNCDPSLSHLISQSFNQCLEVGYYPKELKIALVIPIFKKGDASMMNNYRPISVLPILNKVFEKLIYKRILKYLEKINFFFKRQYGFRAFSSTIGCAIDLLDYIYREIDSSKVVTSVFLDLSKAFDMVYHQLLLLKLDGYGIRGVANDFFRSYLTERSQYVSVGGAESGLLQVSRGVPQGSVLGPLLFLIYMNDISSLQLKAELFLFADDTVLLFSSDSIENNCDMAEIDLMSVQRYFSANGLNLNADKTKMMHFMTNRKQESNSHRRILQISEKPIETVSKFKYLGLLLDSHLTWNEHVDYVIDKIRPIVAILYRTKQLIPVNVRRMIYFSMIHSQMNYMIELWGFASACYLDTIQVMQNRAIRNILDLPFLTPRVHLFDNQELRVLPVRAMHKYSIATFVFKKLKGLTLSELNLESARHQYESRNRDQFIRPKCRLTLCQRRISFAGPVTFNKLPESCKLASTLTAFKKGCYDFVKQGLHQYF